VPWSITCRRTTPLLPLFCTSLLIGRRHKILERGGYSVEPELFCEIQDVCDSTRASVRIGCPVYTDKIIRTQDDILLEARAANSRTCCQADIGRSWISLRVKCEDAVNGSTSLARYYLSIVGSIIVCLDLSQQYQQWDGNVQENRRLLEPWTLRLTYILLQANYFREHKLSKICLGAEPPDISFLVSLCSITIKGQDCV
jgi:hypothetical protein